MSKLQWVRWALAVVPVLVIAAAVASDLGVWASMPATEVAVNGLVAVFAFAVVIANLDAPRRRDW